MDKIASHSIYDEMEFYHTYSKPTGNTAYVVSVDDDGVSIGLYSVNHELHIDPLDPRFIGVIERAFLV